MKHRTLPLFSLCLLLAGLCCLDRASSAAASERIVTLGTAGVTGVYYPAGGAICRLVNRGRKEHGIRCMVESTGGSINNLESIRDSELDMGIVQSDWLYHAYNGSEVFKTDGPDKHLRVLFALHSEPFTVIARKDSGINKFDNLKGKRVNIGNPGSGMRATMEELMHIKGWDENAFGSVADFKPTDQAQALCGNRIDAMIYAVGHPNGAVQQATTLCPTKMIDLKGSDIEALLAKHPFYMPATIPGGMYAGNPADVHTFGVQALLVASDELDPEIVYQFVKAVFDNLENFKTLHPVFATLKAEEMVSNANGIAPMHEGAVRYFKEKGLLQ